MKAVSGGSAASRASTHASSATNGAVPKATRALRSAPALGSGVATALPTSSSRDCMYANYGCGGGGVGDEAATAAAGLRQQCRPSHLLVQPQVGLATKLACQAHLAT